MNFVWHNVYVQGGVWCVWHEVVRCTSSELCKVQCEVCVAWYEVCEVCVV